MNITLTVKERLLLPTLLKAQGKYEDMVAREELVKKTKFSAEEVEAMNMRQLDNGSIVWNPEDDKEVSLDLTELERAFLAKSMKELSEQEKLPVDALTLWKKVNTEEKQA